MIQGGDRRSNGEGRRKRAKLAPHNVREWWNAQKRERPFAAIADRSLSFYEINNEVRDRPPSMVIEEGRRTYLFLTGEARDRFVEEFHADFNARAIPLEQA